MVIGSPMMTLSKTHHHHHHHHQLLPLSPSPCYSIPALRRNPNFAPISSNNSPFSSSSSRVPKLHFAPLVAQASAQPPPRPVVILPGLGNNKNDYLELKSSLEDRGLKATILEVSRPDWLRNALGLLDRNYWAGKLTPRPVLDWYFEKMSKAIAEAKGTGDMKVSLLAHSAGGWLARAYMSDNGIDDIGMLLSLGSPHLPPPKGVPGVIDQTRGLLDYVNSVCPHTFFEPHVKYVCVAGRFVKGERFFPAKVPVVNTLGIGPVAPIADGTKMSGLTQTRDEEGDEKSAESIPTFQARIVGQGYKQVCGQADVWGDGVVPEVSAHLDGANNITIDGVYHSPVGAQSPGRPWYGSTGILEQWVHHLH